MVKNFGNKFSRPFFERDNSVKFGVFKFGAITSPLIPMMRMLCIALFVLCLSLLELIRTSGQCQCSVLMFDMNEHGDISNKTNVSIVEYTSADGFLDSDMNILKEVESFPENSNVYTAFELKYDEKRQQYQFVNNASAMSSIVLDQETTVETVQDHSGVVLLANKGTMCWNCYGIGNRCKCDSADKKVVQVTVIFLRNSEQAFILRIDVFIHKNH